MDTQQKPNIYQPSLLKGALRQGEILTDLIQIVASPSTLFDRQPTAQQITHPFVIVVTQDCDLEQDYRARETRDSGSHRLLTSILFCEVTLATSFKAETPPEIASTRKWKDYIQRNKDERYHFFQKVNPEDDLLETGIGELVAAFRQYFSMPPDEVYLRLEDGNAKRRCVLVSPYLEHFSTRFAYYQSRVALPGQHESEKAE